MTIDSTRNYILQINIIVQITKIIVFHRPVFLPGAEFLETRKSDLKSCFNFSKGLPSLELILFLVKLMVMGETHISNCDVDEQKFKKLNNQLEVLNTSEFISFNQYTFICTL